MLAEVHVVQNTATMGGMFGNAALGWSGEVGTAPPIADDILDDFFMVSAMLLVVGCWLLAVGCWVVGCGLLAAGCGLLAVGCWLWVVGCWLLAVGCWLLADG